MSDQTQTKDMAGAAQGTEKVPVHERSLDWWLSQSFDDPSAAEAAKKAALHAMRRTFYKKVGGLAIHHLVEAIRAQPGVPANLREYIPPAQVSTLAAKDDTISVTVCDELLIALCEEGRLEPASAENTGAPPPDTMVFWVLGDGSVPGAANCVRQILCWLSIENGSITKLIKFLGWPENKF